MKLRRLTPQHLMDSPVQDGPRPASSVYIHAIPFPHQLKQRQKIPWWCKLNMRPFKLLWKIFKWIFKAHLNCNFADSCYGKTIQSLHSDACILHAGITAHPSVTSPMMPFHRALSEFGLKAAHLSNEAPLEFSSNTGHLSCNVWFWNTLRSNKGPAVDAPPRVTSRSTLEAQEGRVRCNNGDI